MTSQGKNLSISKHSNTGDAACKHTRCEIQLNLFLSLRVIYNPNGYGIPAIAKDKETKQVLPVAKKTLSEGERDTGIEARDGGCYRRRNNLPDLGKGGTQNEARAR